MEDLASNATVDGGVWGQAFHYKDLAHLLVPSQFFWDRLDANQKYESGVKTQEIAKLSAALSKQNIPHRLTDIVLEIKLY